MTLEQREQQKREQKRDSRVSACLVTCKLAESKGDVLLWVATHWGALPALDPLLAAWLKASDTQTHSCPGAFAPAVSLA